MVGSLTSFCICSVIECRAGGLCLHASSLYLKARSLMLSCANPCISCKLLTQEGLMSQINAQGIAPPILVHSSFDAPEVSVIMKIDIGDQLLYMLLAFMHAFKQCWHDSLHSCSSLRHHYGLMQFAEASLL